MYLNFVGEIVHYFHYFATERSSEEEESTECLESQEESRVDMSSELVHVDFEVYGTVQGNSSNYSNLCYSLTSLIKTCH